MEWAWLFVNIVLPGAFPIAGLLVIRFTTPRNAIDKRKFKLMNVLKDGQLGWIASAFSSSALFDFIEINSIYMNNKLHTFHEVWFIFLLPILLSMILGVFAGAQGAVYETLLLDRSVKKWSIWVAHYQIFVVSFIASIVGALTWVLIHFAMANELTLNFAQG